MDIRFRNRTEAGSRLAGALSAFATRDDLLVLALPRGGVPVAFEVARALAAPLDVFVVRKLGVPQQEELAMGAIGSGGVQVLNREVINLLDIPATVIERVAARERRELERRELIYRAGLPVLEPRGRTVILVDDGIAAGSSMLAAIGALRKRDVARIVVAVPVVAVDVAVVMRRTADEVVAVATPDDFGGVGQWYDDFTQTTDEEVTALLARTDDGDKPES